MPGVVVERSALFRGRTAIRAVNKVDEKGVSDGARNEHLRKYNLVLGILLLFTVSKALFW